MDTLEVQSNLDFVNLTVKLKMLTESNINKSEKITHGTIWRLKNSVNAFLLIESKINRTEINKIEIRLYIVMFSCIPKIK